MTWALTRHMLIVLQWSEAALLVQSPSFPAISRAISSPPVIFTYPACIGVMNGDILVIDSAYSMQMVASVS